MAGNFSSQAVLPRLLTTDNAILSIVFLFGVAIHGVFLIQGFGEPDAARLINDAVIWHHNPGYLSSPDVEYRPRILPLALILFRGLLDAGVGVASLPAVMNALNLGFGAILPVALFLAWRRIVNRETAFLAIAFVSTMPAVWVASIYGYPHLIGFTLFVFALYLFLLALERKGAAFAAWCAASAVTLGIGLGFKADIVLAFGAFYVVIWVKRRLGISTFLAATCVGAFGIAVPLILHQVIAEPAMDSVVFADNWGDRFPFSLPAMFTPRNLYVKARVGGYLYAVLVFVAVLYLFRNRDDRRIVILACAWAIPVVLFWDSRINDSARHLMSAIVPAGLLIATLVYRVFPRPALRWTAFGLAFVLNYFIGTVHHSVGSPSPRFLGSSPLIQAWVTRIHGAAETIAGYQDGKIFLVGHWANPYATYAMLAKSVSVRYRGKGLLDLEIRDGTTRRFEQVYTLDAKEARRLARVKSAHGFRVVSLNFKDLNIPANGS